MYTGSICLYSDLAPEALAAVAARCIGLLCAKPPSEMDVMEEGYRQFRWIKEDAGIPINANLRRVTVPGQRVRVDRPLREFIARYCCRQEVCCDLYPVPLADAIHTELLRTLGKDVLRDYWISGIHIAVGPHDLVDTSDRDRPLLLAQPNLSIAAYGGEAPWNDVKDLVWRTILESDAFARFKREVEAIAGPMHVCRF